MSPGGNNSQSHQLEKSALLGTPPYLAPELISESELGYSSKIDIWALGVLYFYMLFKKFPFYYLQQKDLYIQSNKGRFMYFIKSESDFEKSTHFIHSFLQENQKLGRISEESYSFLKAIF